MAGRKKSKVDKDRDGARFVALPHVVLESLGWRQAGHVARSLLIDVAQQYTSDNNGRLVACDKYLRPMGWKSHDVITRALRDLLACGLLIETRKGARPNRTAWYALPWYALHVRDGLDISPRHYARGAYRTPEKPPEKNAGLIPSHGVGRTGIAPPHGVEASALAPPHGAMRCDSPPAPIPSHGGYLEKPSAALGSEDPQGPQRLARGDPEMKSTLPSSGIPPLPPAVDRRLLTYWCATPERTDEKGTELGVGTWAQAEAIGQDYRTYMLRFICAFKAAERREARLNRKRVEGVE